MNKNQITMAAIGGVALVIVLALGYFIYDLSDTRAEQELSVQGQLSAYESNKEASREEERAVKANTAEVKEWTESVYERLSDYESVVAPEFISESNSMFKDRVSDEARTYAQTEGAAGTPIVDFESLGRVFVDFANYFVGTSNPPEESQVPRLQRQWGDICRFTDVLIANKAVQLESAKIVTPPPKAPDPRARRGKVEEPADRFVRENYEFVFLASPDALVRILNALATTKAFVTVDAVSFQQDPDPLTSLLKEVGNKKGQDSSAYDAAAEGEEEEDGERVSRSGTVTNPTDPQICTPFRVKMKVSTLVVAKPAKEKAKEVAE